MVRRMRISFEEQNMEDYYQYTAIVKRLNHLKNDPEKKKIVPKMYEVGEPHLAGHGKATWMYFDLLIYFDDNYEKTVKACLRPYYLK